MQERKYAANLCNNNNGGKAQMPGGLLNNAHAPAGHELCARFAFLEKNGVKRTGEIGEGGERRWKEWAIGQLYPWIEVNRGDNTPKDFKKG